MLEIDSYLLLPHAKITDLVDAVNNPHNYFINIKNYVKVNQIANKVDLNYVCGAIYIEYNYQPIINFSHWDLIDQLWAYIIDMIEQFKSQGNASTYFPDQPIKLEFQKLNEKLMFVTLNENRYSFESSIFIEKLLDSAEAFFNVMEQHFGDGLYALQLKKLVEQRNSL
ncbi:hypothetical protein BC351_40165 [Paenibacillus ferrarius]|uniref:Uncharacterized protein n=1 Tax=Paenibacillus ferrarius TaxID=1469647 RepID=A0A1V4H8L7_9BACL|nr:hypothetical protein [Paenibacillus ferrarius]OPH47372.1 hypothetical protein BC351_40165 [Paenibacillus ferrarius]